MRWLLLVLVLLAAPPTLAQNLEAALMPGSVIRGHAETEGECGKCHVRGDKAAQPGLCLDCHKPIAADVRSGQGYHGRLAAKGEKTCRSCHTEHKGREAKIVKLDTQRFDHVQTDFLLKGKHKNKQCDSCHKDRNPQGSTVWRKAPSECIACHRKDDHHKGNLGDKCGNCHHEGDWKDARFDHGKTKFPLRLAHADAECKDCHKEEKYANTPRECVSCHKSDDAHKGGFGPACDKCHNESKWKQPTFRHDRDTHFPLVDKHYGIKCDSCHRASPYKEKLSMRCISCHRKDDAHKGSLGEKCDKCHAAKGWKQTRFDHDLDTKFPLKEKHAQAKCQACHKTDPNKPATDKTRAPTPTACVACHEKDDKEKGHKGRFGDKCESCHTERGFKYGSFDHDGKTNFKLIGKHAKTRCDVCHKAPLTSSNKTDARCIACHEKDDVHFASYGLDCERCHVATDWRKVTQKAP